MWVLRLYGACCLDFAGSFRKRGILAVFCFFYLFNLSFNHQAVREARDETLEGPLA